MEENDNIKMHEIYPFWLESYTILFKKEYMDQFFPMKEMTFIEKLNAIMRLSIYLSIALYIITWNYQYLWIMILVGAITCFVYYNQKDNVEMYFNSYSNDVENEITEEKWKEEKNPVQPDVHNPFMNINLITDDKTKEPAPSSWDNVELQKKIEDKFQYNLYRDVGDLYGKSNSQREFYTMPSTTIPNNQTQFAKWCYGTSPTCKEKSIYCSPEMDAVPYIDNTQSDLYNNVKY
jgi:hypothetical protein